jgi:GNAT superfamily N-acetyltransferase
MKKFEVRPLQRNKIETVALLFHEIWHETQAPLQHPAVATLRDLRFFRSRIEQRAPRTHVAIIKSQIVGFACWSPGFLNSLFVAADARGTGAGTALCEAAENAIRAQGATSLSLDCVQENWPARHFYEKRGWRFDHLHDDEDLRPEGVAPTQLWRMVK